MTHLPLLAFALALLASPSAAETVQPVAGQGWWAFSPPEDRFDPASKLDLRYLNEAYAGEHGFIRLSEDGESFVRADGEAIRFWGGTVSAEGSHEDIDRMARFLAKRGVNMVRWHGNLAPTDRRDSQITDINEKALDQLFYLIAAMKKEGIYVTVSPYWAFFDRMHDDSGARTQPNWPLPRNPEANSTTGLLFYDPLMIEAYRSWMDALFLRENPYTGKALREEPAVAVFQIQNEDSLLFWTFNTIQGADRDQLEQEFGDWLKQKYATLEAAKTAWDGAEATGAPSPDRPDKGMMALPNIYELTQGQPVGGLGKRDADTTEFLTRTMYRFNRGMQHWLRYELAVTSLINAGNWRTASMERLNDAERYSYTSTDIIAVNRYVTGRHESDTAGWAIKTGDRYTDVSTLTDPGSFPLAVKQPTGHPMMVTESLWVPPTAYESEAPFLISAMQSIAGVDAYYWFHLGGKGAWDQPRSANGYMPSIGKWIANSPMTLGQFPAAALIYRQGYIDPAPVAVSEHRTLDELWRRDVSLIAEEGGFDPNRDGVPYAKGGAGTVSPLAFLTGPVKVTYASTANDNVIDLAKQMKPGAVTSLGGALIWNYADGIARLDTPKAQGVSGFLSKQREFALSDVEIVSDNAYATVLVASLDGMPLRASRKVLIQVGTQARPTGWVDTDATWTDPDGKTVTGRQVANHGGAPWLVADSQFSIRLTNRSLKRATLLDANGMASGTVEMASAANGPRITLPVNSLYILLEP
ncbi:capsular polysaccharide biosynthesis protein [Asticcacaulis biprosthecium C19]|uniref:Capsular polysaccharide biosynthesis protein n=1 Tax=Asticcacaulis biprosthecium C19 TaxID=715226 RepID=F4QKF2_9CAUL|nr:hypothetical protein [Asticcacaulis biprosthecium]EGF92104.1 capsular polysaccharide biosynthesis protein [Asticcacaulis biprosthecium C19]